MSLSLLSLSKKGEIDFSSNWVEYIFLALLIIGFIVSIALHKNPIVSYVIIFLFGLAVGRLAWFKRHGLLITVMIVVSGFFVGYITGVFYGNKLVFVLLFILGGLISYYAHSKEFLE